MIEGAWRQLNQVPSDGDTASIRVDASHSADFFAARDDRGRLGLVLMLQSRPQRLPSLESLEITAGERADGQWALGIWLESPALQGPFGRLCEDLIEASRGLSTDGLGPFVVGRLERWRQLLEGHTGMGLSKLRGLIGELLVLRSSMRRFGASVALAGWDGPYRAPQDFALPEMRIEVKATFSGARTVRINSADQLAGASRLFLAVMRLTTLPPEGHGLSASQLVSEIEGALGPDDIVELDRRLLASGYSRQADYALQQFRLNDETYFEVRSDFPRITPDVMAAGLSEVSYAIDLGAIAPFEVPSPLEA